MVGIRSQIPYRPGGWVLHQPPWSFGFDSQTRGTREIRRTLARVAIVCIHVDECPARHRHQEERSVLWFFFVAPHAACRSFAPGIVASVCVREAQYAHGRRSPWCELSFYLRVAGGVLGRGNHASTRSDILLCPKVRRSQEALGGRASPRGLHRSEVQ